ncbi:MAG: hypothetical protein ACI9SY_000353 [Candidatus Paceibacteria bacterium]|jgi:hypothetical protein
MTDLSSTIGAGNLAKPIHLFGGPVTQETKPATAHLPTILPYPEETATGTFHVIREWLGAKFTRFGQQLQDWGIKHEAWRAEKLRKQQSSLTEAELRQEFATGRKCGCGGAPNCNYCSHLMADMGLAGTRKS